MRNLTKLFKMMILLIGIVLVFSLIGCELEETNSNLDGTWVGNGWVYIFSGSDYTHLSERAYGRSNWTKGTFSLNAAKTKFTENCTHRWVGGVWRDDTAWTGTEVYDIVISGNKFTLSRNGFSDTYTRE